MNQVLCVHKNRLFRESLAKLLSGYEQFEVTHLDHAGLDFISRLKSERPGLVLIDLHLPGRQTVGLTQFVREQFGAQVVLLLPGFSEESELDRQLVLECLEAGAQGYVLEDSSIEDLKAALDDVIAGRMFCSPLLMQDMFGQLASYSREVRLRTSPDASVLTQRETEILSYVADGLSNKEVARELSLSLYTVKNHIHRILGKLQAQDRREAVQRGLEHQLISAPRSLNARF